MSERVVRARVVAVDKDRWGQNLGVEWVHADGVMRRGTNTHNAEHARAGYRDFVVGDAIYLKVHGGPGCEMHCEFIVRPPEPYHTPEQALEALKLATVLAGRIEQLALREGGESVTTMVLAGQVVNTGREPKDNIVRVRVPGEERARLARFDATMFDAKGLTPTPGLEIDLEVSLVPSERIEVHTMAPRGKLGKYDAEAKRPGDMAKLEVLDGPPQEALPPGLRYVAVDPDYVSPPGLADYFNTMEILSRKGIRVMGEMIGPAGCGKTSAAYDFAARQHRPFMKLDMGTIVSPDQLLGHREFRDNQTEYIVSQLVRALGTERAVVFLDEINRISPSNSGPLFPLLDHTGEVWSDYLQTNVRVHPSVVIFGASNRGASFTGTYIMDEALESRLQFPVEVTYPEAKMEATILEKRCGIPATVARSLVEFANEVRKRAESESDDLDRSISTRACIAVGHLVGAGMKPAEAVKRSILPRYSNEGGANSPRSTVAKILQGKFAG